MGDEVLVVTKWARYGKERLYVTRADGAKVGWWDLVTEEPHPESADLLVDLTTAVTSWRAGQETDPPPSKNSTPAPALPSDQDAGQENPVAETLTPPAITERQAETAITATDDSVKPSTSSSAQPWYDLAGNRPGERVREQALAEKAAQGGVYTALSRLFDMKTPERAWRLGADGEEMVAAQLNKVARRNPRWRFLHSVPVGKLESDIDHVLIGPGGVFTANTKHHPDATIWAGGRKFTVNGSNQLYIRNSLHESQRAEKFLSAACGFPVPVTGIIIPVGAKQLIVKTLAAGVDVVDRSHIAAWLLAQPTVLDAGQLDAIYEMARRSTTWTR